MRALIALLGVAVALSPLAGGYYDSSIWAPAGLGVIAVFTALLIARAPRLSVLPVIAILSLIGLAILSLLSATWTDSIQQAIFEGNRMVVYSAAIGLLVLVVIDDRAAKWLLTAIGAGAALVAAVVVVRLLDGDETILLNGRINEPLGYVNGQAGFFVLALWPCLALAGHRDSASLAGVGLGLATLLGALVILAQSRGAVLAIALSAITVLLILPDRLRLISAFLVVGTCLAPAVPTLLDVYDAAKDGAGMDDSLRDAGAVGLISAFIAAVAWSAVVRSQAVIGALRPALAGLLRRALVAGIVLLGAGGTAVAAASANRIGDYVERQYDAFVTVGRSGGEPSGSRLVAGAGNRYDYWRVAVEAWRTDPIIGIGAGGYDKPYFAHRSTVEDIRQPHSLPLQTLTELGLVGAALLATFLLALAAGARRQVALARTGAASTPVVVAALGIVTAWTVHTSVDWIHLLPGLTGIALCGAAILLRGDRPAGQVSGRRRRVALIAVVGIALAAAASSLSRQSLAEHYRDSAQSALKLDPQRALEQANRALRLDREDVPSYYVKAAALARFGRAGASRAVLLDATRREPQDFVTWALLGDLAVRRGELAEARVHYSRASQLNPRDQALKGLARDPASALDEPAIP